MGLIERLRAINAIKRKLSKTKGILCFSQDWRNPVQWSHYAEKHKGICMGFDIPKENLEKVNHVTKRINCDSTIDLEMMKKFLLTKFDHWAYEKEYRAFIDLDPKEEESGLYFFNFGKDLKLRTVIVGHSSKITRSQVKNALGRLAREVEVFKARVSFTKFQVIRNKNEKLWT